MHWRLASVGFAQACPNKLELCCKLYSLSLKDGGSVQEHIKAMAEMFEALSVIGDPVFDEDHVVYLLYSESTRFLYYGS